MSYISAYRPMFILRSEPSYPQFLSDKDALHQSGILRCTRYYGDHANLSQTDNCKESIATFLVELRHFKSVPLLHTEINCYDIYEY
jgi:hypothetical protein